MVLPHGCRVGCKNRSRGSTLPLIIRTLVKLHQKKSELHADWPHHPIVVISAQITQTIKPKKIDFAHFWCTDSPSGDMQKSRIFLLYDAYFGFYGGLKFGPPGVPPNLWKAITWPVVELERQSWCQSSSFGPKNLIQQKKW